MSSTNQSSLQHSRYRSYFPSVASPVDGDLQDMEDVQTYLAGLSRSQSSMNATLAEILSANPAYAQAYFERYANPVFVKTLDIVNKEVYRYNDLFHNDGSINAAYVDNNHEYVFELNEFSSFSDDHFILLFDTDGVLIPEHCYTAYHLVGGLKILVKDIDPITTEINVQDNCSLTAVIMRKLLHQDFKYGLHSKETNTDSDNYSFLIENGSTIGPLDDASNFVLQVILTTGESVTMLRDVDYSIAVNSATDRISVVVHTDKNLPNYVKFVVTNVHQYQTVDFMFDASECSVSVHDINTDVSTLDVNKLPSAINDTDPIDFFYTIPNQGSFKIHLIDSKSVMLFVGGFKLVPEVDYTVNANGQLLVATRAILATTNLHFKLILNGRFSSNNFHMYQEELTLANNKPIIESTEVVSHLIRKSSMIFTNGRFLPANPDIVTDYAFVIPELGTLKRFEAFSLFMDDPVTTSFIDDFKARKPDIMRYLEAHGVGAELLSDYIAENPALADFVLNVDYDLNMADTLDILIGSVEDWIQTVLVVTTSDTTFPAFPEVSGFRDTGQSGTYLLDATKSNDTSDFPSGLLLNSNRDRSPCSGLIIDLEREIN